MSQNKMAALVWELCTGSHWEEIVVHYNDNVYKSEEDGQGKVYTE